MREEEAQAAKSVSDHDRLLPGEDPRSDAPADAAHWIEVYSQLRKTKQQLVANLKAAMEKQSAEVRAELEASDLRMLELQIQRFERRLAFWHGRLGGHDGAQTRGVPEATAQE